MPASARRRALRAGLSSPEIVVPWCLPIGLRGWSDVAIVHRVQRQGHVAQYVVGSVDETAGGGQYTRTRAFGTREECQAMLAEAGYVLQDRKGVLSLGITDVWRRFPRSAAVRYPVRRRETFECIVESGAEYLFDVSLAHEIAQLLMRPLRMPIDDRLVAHLRTTRTEIDPRYVAALSADDVVASPVLAVFLEGKHFFIDGHHRMTRAVELGIPDLLFYHLPPSITGRVCIAAAGRRTTDLDKGLAMMQWQAADRHRLSDAESNAFYPAGADAPEKETHAPEIDL